MNNPGNQSALTIARHLVKANAKYFIAVWLLMLLLVAIATTVVGLLTTPTTSIVDFAAMPPRYWLLAVGIAATVTITRIYIAHGVTRRHVGGGIVIAAIGISVLLAAFMAATYGLEQLLFDANGWPLQTDVGTRGWHLFDDGAQFGLVFTEFVLVYLAYFFAGWAIGLMFTRVNVIIGILLIPIAYLPAVIVEAVTKSSWPGLVLGDVLEVTLPLAGAFAIAIPILLIQVMVNRAMLKGMAVAAKR
ncbi:hypothetical protein FB566_0358 [Stackebrandtia endophytica]|uniref:Uncharacterized protein n=1 Tax=Stackebrandtia endophytica TaxID=1496996 RepID=A0A543AQM8_9ACTN|nr:hypothetical protein [Stackebrandtia endophytica]TQL74869.1 hypothetical protein FB566_0358 [Stackebrandtia endophytica]